MLISNQQPCETSQLINIFTFILLLVESPIPLHDFNFI